MPTRDFDPYKMMRDADRSEGSVRSRRRVRLTHLIPLVILVLAAVMWPLTQMTLDGNVEAPMPVDQVAGTSTGTAAAQPNDGESGEDQADLQGMEPQSEPITDTASSVVTPPEQVDEDTPSTGTAEPLASTPTIGFFPIVVASAAAMHEAPGANVIRSLPAGTVLNATGRTQDEMWLTALTKDRVAGWVEADKLIPFESGKLPVLLEIGQGSPGSSEANAAASPTPTSVSPAGTTEPTASPSLTTTTAEAPSPAQHSHLVAVARDTGADLRARPEGDLLQSLLTGTAMTTLARTDDDRWLLVRAGTDSTGWVGVDEVFVFNMSALPIVAGGMFDTGQPGAAAKSAAPQAPLPSDETLSSDEVPQDQLLPAPVPTAIVMVGPASESVKPDGSTSTTLSQPVFSTVNPQVSRLNIRAGPGTEHAIIGKALPGEVFAVTGRNEPGTWAQIERPDLPAGSGWVSAELIQISEPIETLSATGEITTGAPASVTDAGLGSPAVSAAEPISATVNTDLSRLNIRSGPGTDYAIIGKALPAEVLAVAGRNEAGTWARIERPDLPAGSGWVSAELIQLSAPIENLSVAIAEVATGVTAPATDAGQAPPVMLATEQVTATVDTEGAHLNIRCGPSTDYAVIDQAQPGAVLPASGRNEAATWIQIATPDLSCSTGWVSAEYVQLSEAIEHLPIIEMDVAPPIMSAAGQLTATVDTEGARLNIRRGPSTDYAISGKALPDETFPATGRNEAGTWVLIFVADKPYGAGWVSTEYIQLSGPITGLPVVQVDYLPP